jgi:hypothetical protein
MDDRSVIAFSLALGLVIIAGWMTLRYVRKRQAFKLRQSGRGKTL